MSSLSTSMDCLTGTIVDARGASGLSAPAHRPKAVVTSAFAKQTITRWMTTNLHPRRLTEAVP